jgi:hypothetical protein
VAAVALLSAPAAVGVGLPAGDAPARTSAAAQAARTLPAAADPRGVVGPGVVGADISWPNCPVGMGVPGRRTLGLPLPKSSARFVIIGVTNGRAFTRNPCLVMHRQMAQKRGLRTSAYTMLSYPNRAERRKYGAAGPYASRYYINRIANVGYAQTMVAIAGMRSAGLASPFLWIDVEPRAERGWSARSNRNRALIAGAFRAARERGLGVGIYTYAGAWTSITDDWQLPVPLWAPGHSHASTYSKRRTATRASCARVGFTGGPLILTQWVWRNRDHDVTCTRIRTVHGPLWVDYRR